MGISAFALLYRFISKLGHIMAQITIYFYMDIAFFTSGIS